MKKNNSEKPEDKPYEGKAYAFVAIGATVAAAAALGLVFTPLGIYSLIGSILLSLAALAFVNVQQRKNNFDKLFIIKVFAYIALAVSVATFVGGIIFAIN